MNIIDFNSLDRLVNRETLDSHLGDDSDERRRQKRMADTIKKRGLHAADNASDVDEAEDDEEQGDTEDKETGVPTPEGGKEDAPRKDRSKGKGTPDSKKLRVPTESEIKKVTVGGVIDKLNAMRGGKSLKDPDVKKSFQQYFNSLTKRERESLLVFMTGMAQILAGVASGEEALDPGDVGLRVKGPVKKSKEARDEDKSEKKDKDQAARGRPGSPGTPIIVGEAQNKHAIKSALATYRRYK